MRPTAYLWCAKGSKPRFQSVPATSTLNVRTACVGTEDSNNDATAPSQAGESSPLHSPLCCAECPACVLAGGVQVLQARLVVQAATLHRGRKRLEAHRESGGV